MQGLMKYFVLTVTPLNNVQPASKPISNNIPDGSKTQVYTHVYPRHCRHIREGKACQHLTRPYPCITNINQCPMQSRM